MLEIGLAFNYDIFDVLVTVDCRVVTAYCSGYESPILLTVCCIRVEAWDTSETRMERTTWHVQKQTHKTLVSKFVFQ